MIGNISFSRPVLYIFPGYHGDAAMFCMKGFNMLVDGGYSRRVCFWDFARHLDGVDAMLVTHLGPDNLFGLKAMLERKTANNIHPSLDYIYMNCPKNGATKSIMNGDAEQSNELVINLAVEGSKIVELTRNLGLIPHNLMRPMSGNLEPVNLFHKVGQGSLDMYVLNPVQDAKETKDFLAQWSKQANNFSSSSGIPIPNCSSICALLVVRPASPSEKVTRILFPGSAPQHKLIEGLERVKQLEFLKHPTYCSQDSQKAKKPPSSATANGRGGSVPRSRPPSSTPRPSSLNTTTTRVSSATSRTTRAEPPKKPELKKSEPIKKAEAPKRTETKPSPRPASASKPKPKETSKQVKETTNKRASSAKDKEKVKLDEKEKEKPKSATSSPSKSPAKTPTSPKKSAIKSLDKNTIVAESAAVIKTEPPAPMPTEPILQEPVKEPLAMDDNRFSESPDALSPSAGEPAVPEFQPLSEKERLRELGIYDDDEVLEEQNSA